MTDTYTEDEIREAIQQGNDVGMGAYEVTPGEVIAALKKPKFAEGQVICTPEGSLIRYCEALAEGFIGYRNLTLSEHGPAVRALRGCVEISIGRTIGTLTADLHKALAAFDEAIHD